jgi:hypothetical protein
MSVTRVIRPIIAKRDRMSICNFLNCNFLARYVGGAGASYAKSPFRQSRCLYDGRLTSLGSSSPHIDARDIGCRHDHQINRQHVLMARKQPFLRPLGVDKHCRATSMLPA